MILADFRRQIEIGAKERCAKLGNQFLPRIAFVAMPNAAVCAIADSTHETAGPR
jgi:hypothetical protein